jgi:AmmeMemoRadiSam system protein A
MIDQLSKTERLLLLKLARDAIVEEIENHRSLQIEIKSYPPRLQEPGATFVTLTLHGQLRGCIGTLEPYQSLVEDVSEHAVAAALQDYRFPALTAVEIPNIKIEISRLTLPIEIEYSSSEDLLNSIRFNVDGVLIKSGMRRATFLPQVWSKVSSKEEFLNLLCLKMGAHENLWRYENLKVFTYQVEEFKEA